MKASCCFEVVVYAKVTMPFKGHFEDQTLIIESITLAHSLCVNINFFFFVTIFIHFTLEQFSLGYFDLTLIFLHIRY